MRKILTAAVAMAAMACGPEAPVDTGLDAMGLMAWRGSPQVAIYLDAPSAPPDVVERIRVDILRRTSSPARFVAQNYLVPEVLRVHTGYCGLIVDTRTETVTSSASGCSLADSSAVPRDGATPLTFGPVQGVLATATVTRTASEIRIATTWDAHASSTGERPQPWDGSVSITYVLTR